MRSTVLTSHPGLDHRVSCGLRSTWRQALSAAMVFSVLVVVACSSDHGEMAKRIASMQDEITRLQGNQDVLGDRVDGVELQLKTMARRDPGNANRSTPDRGRTERPRLKVIHLAPGQDRPPDAKDHPYSAPAAPAPIDSEQPEEDGDRPVIRVRGKRTSLGAGASDRAAADGYDGAMRLVRARDYDAAVDALSRFLEAHPRHPRSDNALYWRGECFYARGAYALAVSDFAGVLRRYPRGNKVPDALLKLGMSQARLGRTDSARAAFERLSQNYPSTEAAHLIPRR